MDKSIWGVTKDPDSSKFLTTHEPEFRNGEMTKGHSYINAKKGIMHKLQDHQVFS